MNISIISRSLFTLSIVACLGMSSLSAMNRQIFLSSKKTVSKMNVFYGNKLLLDKKIEELQDKLFQLHTEIRAYILDYVTQQLDNSFDDQAWLESFEVLLQEEFNDISWRCLQHELINMFGPEMWTMLNEQLLETSKEYKRLQEEISSYKRAINQYLQEATAPSNSTFIVLANTDNSADTTSSEEAVEQLQ